MAAASGESGSRFVSDAVPMYAMVDSDGLFFSMRRLWNAFFSSTVSRSFDVTRIRPVVFCQISRVIGLKKKIIIMSTHHLQRNMTFWPLFGIQFVGHTRQLP
jgi:hypothetical protein